MKILPERTPEQLVDDPAHLAEPQPEGFLEFRIPPLGAILLPPQFGIVRIGHVIDIGGGQPGMVQAETDRAFGELMRVVELRRLAVLDSVEPFLLDGRDQHAVDEQGCGRLVIHGIDSKNVHRLNLPSCDCCRREPSKHSAGLAASLARG